DYPSLTFSEFRQIVHAAPMLEKLSIHGELITEWESLSAVEATNLRSLTLKFIPVPSFLFTLFTALDAPQLHELCLISISDMDMNPMGSSTFPSVRQLLLEAPRFTVRILPRFCQIVPNVAELTVRGGMTVELESFLRQAKGWRELHTLELLGSSQRVN